MPEELGRIGTLTRRLFLRRTDDRREGPVSAPTHGWPWSTSCAELESGRFPPVLSGFRPASTRGGGTLGGRTAKGGSLRPRRLPGRCMSCRRRTLARAAARLSRERALRGSRVTFSLERVTRGPRTRWRRRRAAAAPLAQGSFRCATSAFGCRPLLRRGKIDARFARLRQPDRDRLFRRSRAVLALANVIHLFADEFACLRWRSPASAFRRTGSLECGLLWHIAELRKFCARSAFSTPSHWPCVSLAVASLSTCPGERFRDAITDSADGSVDARHGDAHLLVHDSQRASK